jgi:PAS domain S-box-containing protein
LWNFRHNLLVQFSVTSFVILAAVAVVLIYTLSSMIRSNAIDDLVDEAIGATSMQILKAVTPEDLRTPMVGERYDSFHEFVQTSIVSNRTARIKLWSADGTVIYSNDRAGVGEMFPNNENLLAALAGENAVEVSVPQNAEHDLERDLGTLMEVYTPVTFPGETQPGGVFEIYQYYAPVAQRISDLRMLVIFSVIGGFVALYAGLVFIVGSGWKTITRQKIQLETVNRELADRVTEVRGYNNRLSQEAVERALAQDALRNAEEKYRSFIENVNDSIVVLQNGQTVYRNPAYEELLGYNVEETAGQSFLDNVAEDDRDRVRGHYQARLRGEDVPDQYEVRLITRDGSRATVEVRPRVIDYEGEQATLVMMRDITERKQLEEQLFQSQKMESIGQLAGGVAHDFNNLLTAVLGFSELAAIQLASQGRVNPKYLDEIQLSGGRGAQLTKQLLTYSRRQVGELQIVDLNELIANLDGMLRRLIGENVELVVNTAPELASVKADPGQIEQALVNLTVNARDAMPTGGRLTIQTENTHVGDEIYDMDCEAQPGDYVMVQVSDTGAGITPEVLGRIFEPFFTTKLAGQGTGLGLSTTHSIIKHNSGWIRVESRLGEGSVFSIYIPMVEDTAPKSLQPDRINGLLTGAETVLVVEDELVVRRLTTEVLERQGYTVLSASDGAEAVRVMEDHSGRIDLLLTDVIMPIMGGYELAERYQLAYPNGSTVYMSGYPEPRVSDQDIRESEVAFLAKPVSIVELTQEVRQTLDKRPTADAVIAD